MRSLDTPPGVTVLGAAGPRYEEVLDASALGLLAELQRRFGARRKELLQRRIERQARFDLGERPDFLPETKDVREGSWSVAPPAPGLVDRRVEITGPTERKMTINALNSGAKVWLADFEDANTPRWDNMVEGQLNLRDALTRTIDFTSPEGKRYALADKLATIVARPRGWHLSERHVLVDGEAVSASLFDFAVNLASCAELQLAAGLGPYFYLPKLESHLEARLWNDVFVVAEDALGMTRGSIRATVLIETLPAAFEMDEILFELREHSAGLNAGRWDYLFSLIKKFRNCGADFILPDRNSVTMAAPFMRAYAELLVRTCHSRGAHAIGGMAAFIPNRRDDAVNAVAMEKVREDKTREANDGFDGSWVAHPDLVPLCDEVFTSVLGASPNQIGRRRSDVVVQAADLLAVSSTKGAPTMEGLHNDVSVGLQYLASWLAGNGAVAIFNLMEDAATAEIARSQVWQWVHNAVVLQSGEQVSAELVQAVIDQELEVLAKQLGAGFDAHRFSQARALFVKVALDDDFCDFLTLVAQDWLE